MIRPYESLSEEEKEIIKKEFDATVIEHTGPFFFSVTGDHLRPRNEDKTNLDTK